MTFQLAIVDTILKYLEVLTPWAEAIILYIIPIYITIGEVFANLGLVFLSILPKNSFILSFIIMGVFIVLGVLGGILSKTEEEKRDAAKKEPVESPKEQTYDF